MVVLALFTYLPAFLNLRRGLSLPQAGLLAGIPSLVSIASGAAGGVLSDRIGSRKRVSLAGLLLMAATMPLTVVACAAGRARFPSGCPGARHRPRADQHLFRRRGSGGWRAAGRPCHGRHHGGPERGVSPRAGRFRRARRFGGRLAPGLREPRGDEPRGRGGRGFHEAPVGPLAPLGPAATGQPPAAIPPHHRSPVSSHPTAAG